jgi:hypothetical protein
MERGLGGLPKWPKFAALIRHLPSSRLAKAFDALDGGKMRRKAAMESADQTLRLLLDLRQTDFEDKAWCDAIAGTLESCTAIVEKKMTRNRDE